MLDVHVCIMSMESELKINFMNLIKWIIKSLCKNRVRRQKRAQCLEVKTFKGYIDRGIAVHNRDWGEAPARGPTAWSIQLTLEDSLMRYLLIRYCKHRIENTSDGQDCRVLRNCLLKPTDFVFERTMIRGQNDTL